MDFLRSNIFETAIIDGINQKGSSLSSIYKGENLKVKSYTMITGVTRPLSFAMEKTGGLVLNAGFNIGSRLLDVISDIRNHEPDSVDTNKFPEEKPSSMVDKGEVKTEEQDITKNDIEIQGNNENILDTEKNVAGDENNAPDNENNIIKDENSIDVSEKDDELKDRVSPEENLERIETEEKTVDATVEDMENHIEKESPGKKYTVSGVLMDKATKEPLLVNKKEITAEKIFTAEKAAGSVDIEFSFDASVLQDKTIVAFETMTMDGKEVAVHTDINDKDQSIYFPKIGTTATIGGSHEAAATKNVTIVDKVEYKNLTKGEKYKVVGTLMDKGTKEPLLIDGKTVTAEKTFKAKSENGSVDLEFTFNAESLGDRTIVVFEKLYTAEGDVNIANHEDIDDNDQTVTLTKTTTPGTSTPGTGTSTPKKVQTGDSLALFVFIGVGLVLLISGSVLVY